MDQIAHMEVVVVEHLAGIERIGICLEGVPLGVVGEVSIIGIAVEVEPVIESIFNRLMDVVADVGFAHKFGDLRELHQFQERFTRPVGIGKPTEITGRVRCGLVRNEQLPQCFLLRIIERRRECGEYSAGGKVGLNRTCFDRGHTPPRTGICGGRKCVDLRMPGQMRIECDDGLSAAALATEAVVVIEFQ